MQPLLDAFSLGGTYALAALGLGLVFGVLKLVNFAHAELITISAYVMVITNDLPLVIVRD
jgi:branched-chain amino acid transport system permease protein